MRSFVALSIALAVTVPIALLGGVVLSDFWRWFILPVFVGAPTLSTTQAIGVALVASFFKTGLKTADITEDDDDDAPIIKTLVRAIQVVALYLLLWGYGALWHTFA